mmetsp:Transcript_21540/g.54675  ORF Transcript_21540/g.54675 Transcript_21540/m.54675 type:complete len:565 (+) Transcript_21540:167-1861(+)
MAPMRKNYSTPNHMEHIGDDSQLCPVRSEQDLSDMDSLGMFTRKSSFADVPYLALPGINSRVSMTGTASQQSLRSELGEHFLQGDVTLLPSFSSALLKATFAALLSTFSFGYNNGNMNTQARVMRVSLSIPAHAEDGAPLPANDVIWGFCSGPSSTVMGTGAPLSHLAVIFGPECVCLARVLTLVAGRVISGIACGGVTVVVPMYLGEISPPQLRGTLGTAFQLTMVTAILIGQVLGLDAFLGTAELWPCMLGLVCVPAFVQLLLQSWLLESPRWYMMAGMEVPAETILMLLRDTPIDDPQLQEELFCMVEACAPAEPSGQSVNSWLGRGDDSGELMRVNVMVGRSRSLCSMLTDPALRLPMGLAVGLMAAQQFSGINNAFNFSSTFLAQNGMDQGAIQWITVAMNVGNVLVTALSVYLMDRAGRRVLVLGSMATMVCATALLTAALTMPKTPLTAPLTIVAIVSFVSSFGIGLGPIPWLLPAEVFGMDERASASGFAASCNWFANFAAAQMFLPLSNALGGYSFLPFGAFIAVSFVLTAIYLPETRGKTLEQIRGEMRGGVGR